MSESKFPRHYRFVLAIPWFAVMAALGVLAFIHVDQEVWNRYRGFWGGNPSELYSHWLDMVLMSGNAFLLASLVAAEAFFRSRGTDADLVHRSTRRYFITAVILSGIIATVLDFNRGEGTVPVVHILFFIPILTSSYYLLRKCAAGLRWNPNATAIFCASAAILHLLAQIAYEPSVTGAPGGGIIPIWIGTVLLSLGWAFVGSIRNGKLARLSKRTFRFCTQPAVWVPVGLVIIAVSLYAKRLHNANSNIALPWLNHLEASLSDQTVIKLKGELDPNMASYARIETPSAVKTLLFDERAKTNNSLRLFIPLDPTNYLFLWSNSRFEYCDKRKLENQIDQEFIDAVVASNGTRQTGMFSTIWSRHRAGRVLKDKDGAVKAICIITLSDD